MAKFGEDLKTIGKKTKNKTSQNLGKFIEDHPKTAIAASIPVGGLVLGGIYAKAKGVGRKTIEKLDPNAYAYEKYGVRFKNNNKSEEVEDEVDERERKNG